MEYKNTLNLPRTDFPMRGDLVKREPERLARWESARLYNQIQARRAGAPKFVLHDGPPFANGDVHIGTALNKILKDLVIRFQTIQGKSAPYVPGWDCHGLPIEFKVTQERRKAGRTDDNPAALRTECEAYARKYIQIQREQFKRLGVLGDWDNPYLTLNKQYEADELRLFADLVEKGFVYRGKKPVYWSIPCRTALAEAEVEYRDHVSRSIYVKFPVRGTPNTSIVIWTTTPWTLPANLAVAYNSRFTYTLVRVDDEDYIVSTLLLPTVAEKCGWTNYQEVRSLDGEQVAQLEYQHPFADRTGRLFAGDEFVENTTGTGFVHIAPGHGLEDYGLGSREGLPIYSPVDDNGCLTHTNDLPAERQMPESMVGKLILEKHGSSDANLAVLHELRVAGMLLHEENYHHSYPHCWRSKTPVIFRAMDQWFVRIDHEGFRDRALDEIRRIRWIPEWGRNRIEAAVQGRPDWCISRQRTWGVPIPAFFDSDHEPILDAGVVRKTADLVEQFGSNIWFEKPAEALWKLVRPDNWTGNEAVSKSTDTLDVWIDSGSSSRSVLMRLKQLSHSAEDGRDPAARASAPSAPAPAPARKPPGANAGSSATEAVASRGNAPIPWQADVYLEGSDQHRGWFQSSLLLSLAANGAPPYRTVLTHGFMVDADREKISKSKQGQGGYEKPQTSEAYIRQYGGDIVRLWVASQDFRSDIVVSDERVRKVGETYRLIRNTLRYQLSNLFDFDPATNAVAREKMTGLDRWILEAFSDLESQVADAYDRYEFHLVYQRISQFAAVELSAVYHDIVKDRLYTDPADSHRRRSTQTVLNHLATGLCRMLSPILVFTADEAWEAMAGNAGESVHTEIWTRDPFMRPESERDQWRELFALREQVLPKLEEARQAKVIGKALEAQVTLSADPGTPSIEAARGLTDEFREILNVSQWTWQPLNANANGGNDDTNPRMRITVSRANGEKCERCWHWEPTVGQDTQHPTLCSRCVVAVGSAA